MQLCERDRNGGEGHGRWKETKRTEILWTREREKLLFFISSTIRRKILDYSCNINIESRTVSCYKCGFSYRSKSNALQLFLQVLIRGKLHFSCPNQS